MPRIIGRELNLCFLKIKRPLAICNSSSSPETDDHENEDRSCVTKTSRTTSASANFCSSIFIKNFNSLYDNNTVDCNSESPTQNSSSLSHTSVATASASTSSHENELEPADFVTAFASKRFFFSSPGRSNSIIESTSTSTLDCGVLSSSTSRSSSMAAVSTPPDDRNKKLIIHNSVAIHTRSSDPYTDFRRSMQEMVEARAGTDASMDVKSNWEFLHGLLLSYLSLNPHNTHKFIVEAFADLLVSLRHSQGKKPDDDMSDVIGDGEA